MSNDHGNDHDHQRGPLPDGFSEEALRAAIANSGRDEVQIERLPDHRYVIVHRLFFTTGDTPSMLVAPGLEDWEVRAAVAAIRETARELGRPLTVRGLECLPRLH